MTDRRYPILTALAAASLLALPARADNFGRVTKTHEVVTTIISPPDDVDDFVFDAGAGFKLSASVKRAKGSLLAPVLELVGPDGDVLGLADGVTAKPPGKTSSSLKAVLPVGGRFALRVRAQTIVGELAVTTPWDIAVQSPDIVPGSDLVGLDGHGLVNGDPVTVVSTTDELPGGLALDGDYFVVQATTDTFKLSATVGGAPVDITSTGAGTQVLQVSRGTDTIDSATDTISRAGHGLMDGDLVRVDSSTDTIPAGLSQGTDYYVVAATPASFKLAALPGGSAVNITSGGAGILTLETVHGSTGAGTLKWKLTPAKIAAVKGLAMAANQTTFFPFAARGGALVSWTLKWKGEGGPSVLRILDPEDNEVPFETDDIENQYLVRKATSEVVKKFPIPDGLPGGQYRLEVRNPILPSIVSLSIKVALPKFPKALIAITADEPLLEGMTPSPAVASTGITVTIEGRGLESLPAAILFGDTPATNVSVALGATASDPDVVTCDVPVGSGTVAVQYVAGDGEVALLPEEFTFRPMPVISTFTPTVGPSGGGIEVTISGTGFETLELSGIYDVTINNVPAWPGSVKVLSPTSLACKIPANPAGPWAVHVRNVHSSATSYKVQAPLPFTYSTALGILYLVPDAAPANFPAGIDVSVYGSGFGAADTVYFEDTPGSDEFTAVPSTPIYFNTAVIGHKIAAADLPDKGPGKYDVKVVAASLQSATRADGFSYYAFEDATASSIPAASADDDWGGVSSAAVDSNQDGTVDYIVLTHTAPVSAGNPGTRILVNDGNGVFTAKDPDEAFPGWNSANDDFAGGKILGGRFDNDGAADLFLSRPGSGSTAAKASDGKSVDAWARIFFGDGTGAFNSQIHKGNGSKFSIPGLLVYGSPCFLFDFDFRSVTAGMGDLDGDLDQDIVLVNDSSISWYQGVNCAFVWITCMGYYPSCYSFTAYPNGSALRICTLGSTGAVFDRTKELLAAIPSASDDFRGAAVAVGDMNADFLTDIVVTHSGQPGNGANPIPCTRGFRQRIVGQVISFAKMPSNFVPIPSDDTEDDWRGDAIAIPDLNQDLYRDLIVSVDGAMFNDQVYSTRVLVQDPGTQTMDDRTEDVLGGVLPLGDNGWAKFILPVDLDKDGDTDIILCTPSDAGANNRRTRYLMNTGKDPGTGLPRLVDASQLFPDFADDNGSAACALAADVDGDGDLDLIITDLHYDSGTPVRRTRIWKQVR